MYRPYSQTVEPLTTFEILTSTGFIKIMGIILTPFVIIGLSILLIKYLKYELNKRNKANA